MGNVGGILAEKNQAKRGPYLGETANVSALSANEKTPRMRGCVSTKLNDAYFRPAGRTAATLRFSPWSTPRG